MESLKNDSEQQGLFLDQWDALASEIQKARMEIEEFSRRLN